MATKKSAAKKTASSKKSRAGGSGKVEKVMHEFKHGELETRGRRRVTSRKQAIAIALNEAREAGEPVPPPKKRGAKKAAVNKSTAKKATAKKTAVKKRPSAKKSAAKKRS